MLESLVRLLSSRTRNINIVESDGGSYSWPAEQAFQGHGIPEICERYGARAINLSAYAREQASAEVCGHHVAVEMSRLLLHETDVFITMPVPKVHAMTGVSLGFKNQWGCLPDIKRLNGHPQLPYRVLAIHKLLPRAIAIFDGSYFLNRNGPMDGDPVKMDLLIASDDIGAGTLACCELMQISPRSAPHLRLALRDRLMPSTLEALELNAPIGQFIGPKFYLKRERSQWIAFAAFHSRLATRILYDSPLAKPAHEVLYLIRGRPKDFAPRW